MNATPLNKQSLTEQYKMLNKKVKKSTRRDKRARIAELVPNAEAAAKVGYLRTEHQITN